MNRTKQFFENARQMGSTQSVLSAALRERDRLYGNARFRRWLAESARLPVVQKAFR